MIVKHQNTIGPNVNIFYPAISKLSVQHNRHMAMIVSKNTHKKNKKTKIPKLFNLYPDNARKSHICQILLHYSILL